MKLIIGIGALFLMCAAASAQASNPTPPPELKKLHVWVGNWELSGKAQDQPNGPRYTLRWHLYEHWILDGFFLAVDQTWKGNGQVLHALEMLSYDTGKQVYTDSGFGSDGSTWSLTAIFDNSTMIESGSTRGSDGEITKCRTTWSFRRGGKSLSGTQECDKNGVRWRALDVTGTKS